MHVPLYFLAARVRMDGRRAVRLVLALVMACAVKALFHVAQTRIGGPLFPSSFPVGGEGSEAHSAYVCLYALVIIMGWAMLPYTRTNTGRLLLTVGLGLTLFAVGISLLRVAWIVIVVGSGVVVLVARALPIKRTALLVCVL